jgi:hypothetical protein
MNLLSLTFSIHRFEFFIDIKSNTIREKHGLHLFLSHCSDNISSLQVLSRNVLLVVGSFSEWNTILIIFNVLYTLDRLIFDLFFLYFFLFFSIQLADGL